MKRLITFLILVLTFNVLHGQGIETFDNFTATGSSYQDGTFQGQDGSTWTYVQCRGDFEITGKAIMLGRNRTPQSNFYSGTIFNGIGTLQFDYSQAFSTNVNLNVLINDVVVGNVTSSGEQGIIKNSGIIDVNVNGDFVIKFINVNNSDGQVVIDNVAWSAFNPNMVATPIISYPSGQYFEPIDVQITCDTPNSTIYYTTDGSDPNQSSTQYTAPINISTNTTLKARAYAPGLDPSGIAQAVYTFLEITEVANLAELRAAFSGKNDYYKVTGEVVLTYSQSFRNQKFIQDASAAILIDDNPGVINTVYQIGDGITGITGTLTEYGNMLQFNPFVDPGEPSSTGNQIIPQVITLADMNANFEDYEARLVKIVNAAFSEAGGTFANGTVYQITDNSKAEANFRTTFYDVNYIGTVIPQGVGNIMGILNSRDEGDFITSRFLDDLEWALGEPSNYPTGFSATAYGQAITLNWTDATGEILPSGYLILAADNPAITPPADGVPVINDPDLSDGSAAMNIPYGAQQYTFSDLPVDETYYFQIFPYTGAGGAIDYKTDGAAPSAEATTYQMINLLFTTFDESWENWERYNVTGEQDWDRDNTYGINNTPCARISGYANQMSNENENWLISPEIPLLNYESELLSFYSAVAYTGPALQVKISTEYAGQGNPNSFNWTDLTDQVNWPDGSSFFEWTHSGYIDISAAGSANLYVAFVYFSTNEESATWEVDNIIVSAEQGVGITEQSEDKQITMYPNPGRGIFHVSAENDYDQIRIFTVTGQLIKSLDITGKSYALDVSDIGKGFYMIHFLNRTSGASTVNKIIIE
jgi:hypothetical protein